jgi:hypothetical protein
LKLANAQAPNPDAGPMEPGKGETVDTKA